VELGYPVERQQAQQIEAQDLVLVRRRRDVLEQPTARPPPNVRRVAQRERERRESV